MTLYGDSAFSLFVVYAVSTTLSQQRIAVLLKMPYEILTTNRHTLTAIASIKVCPVGTSCPVSL